MRRERTVAEEVEEMVRAEQSRGRLRRDQRSVDFARETFTRQIEAERAAKNPQLEEKSSSREERPRRSLFPKIEFRKSNSISYSSGRGEDRQNESDNLRVDEEKENDKRNEGLKLLREVLDEMGEKQPETKKESRPQIKITTEPELNIEVIETEVWVPANAVLIELDDEGYPKHPSEEQKFRRLNRIIATNRFRSFFLVEARNSYGIRPGPGYDLPASIIGAKRRPFIVDFGHTVSLEDPYAYVERIVKKGQIYPASGVIIPRKRREPVDTMLGYKHGYVLLDHSDIPDNAFDDIKRANEEYREPPYFES